MTETASYFLIPWSSFYIMTGSSVAALTGLMFVVIALVSRERLQKSPDGVSTFSTPTVAHFCAALFVSAVLSAPWRSLVGPATLLGLTGLSGVVYVTRLVPRTKRLTAYEADLEDWVWFSILPFIAYGAVFVGAAILPIIPVKALFALAAGVLLLIFIGIRNAWDIVTYIAIGGGSEPPSAP